MKLFKYILLCLAVLAFIYISLVITTSMQVESKLNKSVTYINSFIDNNLDINEDEKLFIELRDYDSSFFTHKAKVVLLNKKTFNEDNIAIDEIATIPLTVNINALRFNVVFENIQSQHNFKNNIKELFRRIHYDYDSATISSILCVNVWPFRANFTNIIEANSTLGASGPQDKYPAKISTTIGLVDKKDIHISSDIKHIITEFAYLDNLYTTSIYRVKNQQGLINLEPLKSANLNIDGLYFPNLDESKRFMDYKGDKRQYWIDNAQIKKLSLIQHDLKKHGDEFNFAYNLKADKIFNVLNLEAQGSVLNIPKDILSMRGLDLIDLAKESKAGITLDKLMCDVSYIVNEKVAQKYRKEKSNVPHYDSLKLKANGKFEVANTFFGVIGEAAFRADKQKVKALIENPTNNNEFVIGFFENFNVDGDEAVLDFKLDYNSMNINGISLF